MLVNKCERCGKDINVEKSKDFIDVKCHHCNKEYTIDKKTKRLSMLVVTLLVFILAFTVTIIADAIKISPYILMVPMMLLAIYAHRISLFLLAKANKLSYTAKN